MITDCLKQSAIVLDSVEPIAQVQRLSVVIF